VAFARGLALGALVGAAIAGSRLWKRRREDGGAAVLAAGSHKGGSHKGGSHKEIDGPGEGPSI
jgi:hypothetical protein